MKLLRRLVVRTRDTLQHHRALSRSRHIDIAELRTVCLALGPYRNLTTLTAGMLALHPHCQVLNHAGERIFRDRRLNFLDGYSEGRFEAFARYAIQLSAGGAGGARGGSIVHSHAFERDALRAEYAARFPGVRRKDHIRSLFWKESLRTSVLVRARGIDLSALLRRNRRLRFLMPVRNPLDCAISNLRRGYAPLFDGLAPSASTADLVEAVLREFAWFLDQRDRNPDRFFFFYEDGFDAGVAGQLARFLELAPDPEWIAAVLRVYRLDNRYIHEEGLMATYRRIVRRTFAERPDTRDRLLEFAAPMSEPPVA